MKADKFSPQMSYWKIISMVMNKCSAPKYHLLVNNFFILNCRDKARYVNEYFSQQYKPVIYNSVLPILRCLTNKRIDHVTIENDEIISLIRTLIRLGRIFRSNVNIM